MCRGIRIWSGAGGSRFGLVQAQLPAQDSLCLVDERINTRFFEADDGQSYFNPQEGTVVDSSLVAPPLPGVYDFFFLDGVLLTERSFMASRSFIERTSLRVVRGGAPTGLLGAEPQQSC